MKNILVVWVIIVVLLVGGLTTIGYSLTKQNQAYYQLEIELEEASKAYFSQYPNEFPLKKLVISSEKLVEYDFLRNFKINEEECMGYVIVKKQSIFYKHIPYLKCNDYETKKYDESLVGEV